MKLKMNFIDSSLPTWIYRVSRNIGHTLFNSIRAERGGQICINTFSLSLTQSKSKRLMCTLLLINTRIFWSPRDSGTNWQLAKIKGHPDPESSWSHLGQSTEIQHQKYLNIFKDGVFSPFFDKSFITSSCHFIGQNSH